MLISNVPVLLHPSAKLNAINGKLLKIPEYPAAVQVSVRGMENDKPKTEWERDDIGKVVAGIILDGQNGAQTYLTQLAVEEAQECKDPVLGYDWLIEG